MCNTLIAWGLWAFSENTAHGLAENANYETSMNKEWKHKNLFLTTFLKYPKEISQVKNSIMVHCAR